MSETDTAGITGLDTGGIPPRGTLAQIVESARATLGADRATCYAIDVDSQRVGAVHSTESDPGRLAVLRRAVGRDVRSMPLWPLNLGGDLIAIERVRDDPRIPDGLGAALGAGAFVGVALAHGSVGTETPLGALFCSFSEPRRFTPADLDGVRGVAGLAALALANTHLRRLAARRLEQIRSLVVEHSALRRVATTVAGSAGLDVVAARVAMEAATLLDAEAAVVVRFRQEGAVVVGAHGPAAPPGRLLPLTGADALVAVSADGTAHISEGPIPPAAFALTGPGAVVAAPVMVEGALWGAVAAAGTPWAGAQAVERLTGFAELMGLAAVNARVQERLVTEASTDELTGLLNQRAFNRRLEADVERARRHGRDLSLVIMDLDHFKRVNDRHGHQVGDLVLTGTAERLARCVRRGDTLARIGGEEFAWILPETPVDAALVTAERARRLVGTVPFPTTGLVTMSAGAAGFAPGMTPADLFRAADRALYCAKAAGRDRAIAADQGRSR